MIVEERLATSLDSLESADIPVLDGSDHPQRDKKFSESNAGDQMSGKDS